MIDEDKQVDTTIVEDKITDTTIVADKQPDIFVEDKPIDRTTGVHKQHQFALVNVKLMDDALMGSPEEMANVDPEGLFLSQTAPSRLQLQTSTVSLEDKTPTNLNRHSFGEDSRSRYSLGSAPRFSVGSDPRFSLGSDPRYSMCSDPGFLIGSEPRSGSLESTGSDLHRALLERIPSFQISVSGPEDDPGSSNTSPQHDISSTKTPTNNPATLDAFPSPQLRVRRSFPRSRPVSGDPLSNYSVIPRRKDSYFPPHLLNYGEYYSDSEDDRSCSVTTSYHDESEEESEEDYFSDMEPQTANTLYFMAYEVKRRLSTVPAGAAGLSKTSFFS